MSAMFRAALATAAVSIAVLCVVVSNRVRRTACWHFICPLLAFHLSAASIRVQSGNHHRSVSCSCCIFVCLLQQHVQLCCTAPA